MKKMVRNQGNNRSNPDRMTKAAYMAMVKELAKRAEKDMVIAADELWKSGAIDPDSYSKEGYILPKMFMCAYASRLKRNWGQPHPTRKIQSEIKNFEYFI